MSWPDKSLRRQEGIGEEFHRSLPEKSSNAIQPYLFLLTYRCVDFPILTPCFFVLWLFMYYSTSIPLPPPICCATARDRGRKMARGRAKKKTNLTRLRFYTDTLYKRKAISHTSFPFKNFDYIRFQEIRAWRYISYFNKKWKEFLSDS